MKGKILAIIQARMGSKRLPGKMMLPIAGEPLLKLIFDRLRKSKELDEIILATSVNDGNEALVKLAKKESTECYRGSEDDVLDRFYQITQREKDFALIVRVCGDNPLIDPLEVDRLVGFHQRGGYDYSFNHVPYQDNGYPDGVGAEILSRHILKYIWERADQAHQREHCLDYIWDNTSQFNIGILQAPESIRRPDIKLDVDTEGDLAFLRSLLNHLSYGQIVRLNTEEIIGIYDEKGGLGAEMTSNGGLP
jgi:spore coat polysaccharide biosynthesis protein SpsF